MPPTPPRKPAPPRKPPAPKKPVQKTVQHPQPTAHQLEFIRRNSLLKNAQWGIRWEPRIHYTMELDRDDWLNEAPFTLPVWTDCSGFVTLCYKWAKLPDPNGLGYKWLGYTGTLLDHCHPIEHKDVKIGDLIVYGPETGEHVTMAMGLTHEGIVVVSHGWEGGPRQEMNIIEINAHDPPVRYLRHPIFAAP